MGIKKLRVSFDIDAEMFARMLSAGHSAMNIEVFGEQDPRVSHTEPMKLIGSRGGMRQAILGALVNGSKSMAELRVILVRAGYSVKSMPGAIHLMRQDKLIRSAGFGIIAITKKGTNYNG